MAALHSTPLSKVWLLLASALCSQCAKVSSTDPAVTDSHDGGALTDLAAPDAKDLATATRRDLAMPPRLRDLALASVHDLAMPAPPPDLSQVVDLGPFPPGTFYQISNKQTGQLLSVHNSAVANGSITESQPAHGTGDQRWTLVAAPSGTYRIVNGQSQSCLDVNGASTGDGATVWIWTCGLATSQQWKLQDTGSGFYNFVNVNSMSCLDLDHGNSAPGTVIFQFHCNGGDNQKWFFTLVP